MPSEEIEAIGALGIYEVDLNRGTWRGSPNFLQIFGLERADEYPVEEFIALVHPEDRPGVMAHFEHCLKNEDSFNTSYRCIVQGQEMLVETKTRIYRDDAGKPVAADIFDYKTNQIDEPDARNKLKKKYRPQLALYQTVLAAILGIDVAAVSAALILTRTGEVVPIDGRPLDMP